MAGRTPHRSIGARLAAGAGSVALLLTLLAAPATAKPTLSVPRIAEQGQTAAAVLNPRGSRNCRLVARARGGRSQSRRVPARHATIAYLSIAPRARRGPWALRLRCASGTSAAQPLRVTGTKGRAGRVLFNHLETRLPDGEPPVGYREPNPAQDAATGPKVDTAPGIGGTGSQREERAIEWATSQIGARQYDGWCLRFVAHAFAQEKVPATATLAAIEYGPRDGTKSFLDAPRGALLWFAWGDPDKGNNVGHVGISLGDGTMIHALDSVRVVRIEGSKFWHTRYRGWTHAPETWLGRPGPPPQLEPRKILTVDNRVTNGPTMREDPVLLRLTTQPRTRCGTLGCLINGTERVTGGTYDAAVCQTVGERFTNGHDTSPDDDANPDLYESTLYYGVRLADNTFGYVSEVWIRREDRGGLGLPTCK